MMERSVYFDMNWLILIVAGLFEVVWATALKMSNGFRNPLADVVCAVGMALSVWLLPPGVGLPK